MKRSERDEWTAALRSGAFEQAKGQLRKIIRWDGPERSAVYGYCCLGVKCELDVQAGRHDIQRVGESYYEGSNDARSDTMPTDAIERAWGVPHSTMTTLAHMNDGDGGEEWAGNPQTFAQIADWIDKNVPVED